MPKFLLTIVKTTNPSTELVVEASSIDDAVDSVNAILEGGAGDSDLDEYFSDPGNWDTAAGVEYEVYEARPVRPGEEKNLSYPPEFDVSGHFIE